LAAIPVEFQQESTMLNLLAFWAMLAVDHSGTYRAEVQTSSGKAENVLVLKANGTTLTGTLTNQMGKFAIQNGNVDGEDLFFNVVVKDEGEDFKMTYRGHVFGDEITFKIQAGERVIEMVATKDTAK
jgi:hypothetical protein